MDPEDPRSSSDSVFSPTSGDGEPGASDSPASSGEIQGEEDVADETDPIPRDPSPLDSGERAEAAREQSDPSVGTVDLDFGADDLPARLAEAEDETMHAANFGIVRLDDEGAITLYNRFEQTLSNMGEADVQGRNFFEEVAPCTYSERFSGRFYDGVRDGDLDVQFTYTFSYRMEPLIVKIRLCRDPNGDNYVLVKPMG